MLRFMLSQASTERSSAMRFSTSCGSKVGTAMPGIGTPSGPQRRRNISNGFSGGVSSAMGATGLQPEEFAHLGGARLGVLVAEVDERLAERLLEEQVARDVRARAAERAGRAQHEAHGARQLVDEARGDALERLRRRNKEHFHGLQLQRRVAELVLRDGSCSMSTKSASSQTAGSSLNAGPWNAGRPPTSGGSAKYAASASRTGTSISMSTSGICE